MASVVEKVRINPGNFHKDHDEARRQFARFLANAGDKIISGQITGGLFNQRNAKRFCFINFAKTP